MIKYSIRGENLEVTEAIRDYVVSKLEKIEKYLTKYYNEGGTEKEPEPLPPAGAEKERI